MMRDSRTRPCVQCGGLTAPPDTDDYEEIRVAALREIAADLEGCHEDAWRLWRTLIETEVPFTNAINFSTALGVKEGTLQSRFARAGLPPLKKYLLSVALMRLAAGLEDSRRTLLAVVADLGWPSYPQSLARITHTTMGTNVADFRARETGRSMLLRLRRLHVIPYLAVWRDFRPLAELAPAMRRVQVAGSVAP
ncbi:MAG: hypothetical protein WD825_17155 [Gemmatimonadaceae bacterium]